MVLPAVSIRAGKMEDLAAASDLLRAGGFRDSRRLEVLTFLTEAPAGRTWIADAEGELAAIGGALSFGATGWSCVLGVEAAWRGRGLGPQIGAAMRGFLRERGARTLSLLASPLTSRLFHRTGWADAETYVMAVRPAVGQGGDPPTGVRPLRDTDAEAVRALDVDATGEDRSSVIDPCLRHGGLIFEGDGGVRGFHLDCPWGYGPTIAADPDAGMALMEAIRCRRAGRRTWVLLPIANEAASGALEPDSTRLMTLLRMQNGPPPPWRPEMVFGAFNFYWG